ncbi:MAG: type II and III secretion system protein family protein, partial [Cupriavidus sp.]|nr:type II and III secretion system protein family protein [Cupriavidus sp.]
ALQLDAQKGDSLVLSGNVPDSATAQQVMDIANAFVQRQARSPLQAPPQAMGAPANAASGANMMMGMGGVMMPVTSTTQNSASGMPIRSNKLINMLTVDAPQQVMLEVKVAEVSKTLIDQLGAAANIQGAFGSWQFGLLANFLSGAPSALTAIKNNNLPLALQLDAQKGDSLVKILAEPNLMAISGQEASFLAGGKVFIPVPQSNFGGVTTIVLQEETFGVGLKFTPTVLANGRINLKVAPEVSELSPTGVAVTAPNTSGSTILPLINTRRAATTLQVMDGQSFAIGGLIKSNVTGSLKGLPGAGELPVLGNLFRSTSFQQDRSELLFVVTPRLVKPLPPNYPMPTDSFGPPINGEVYINGNMEGHPQRLPDNLAPPAPTGTASPAPMAPMAPTTSTQPASSATLAAASAQ